MSIHLGETVAGKYRIERVIGEGGMGLVLEALHLQLDQRVAIKVLQTHALTNEEAVTRFMREARAAARIQSEHVVKIFDVSLHPGPASASDGEDPTSTTARVHDGVPYLVMEYLEGRDLDAIVRQDGPLSVVDAVTYLLQACEALAEAHTNGIVHRDLKPANLFVAERADGSHRIKILDFGVSKLLPRGGAENVRVTRTMSLMGSPAYMAPEQMRGAKDVDLRADIWSLGIILHELLAGVAPFEGETLTEVCASIVADPPRKLAAERSDLPPGLEDVVLRCLEKDPARRFQDVSELAQALGRFAPEQAAISVKRTMRVIDRAGVRKASTDPRIPAPSDAPTLATFGVTGEQEKRRPSFHLWLAAAFGLLSVVMAISLMSSPRPAERPTTVTLAPTVEPTAPSAEPAPTPPLAAVLDAKPPANTSPPARATTLHRSSRASTMVRDAGAASTAPKLTADNFVDAGVSNSMSPDLSAEGSISL